MNKKPRETAIDGIWKKKGHFDTKMLKTIKTLHLDGWSGTDYQNKTIPELGTTLYDYLEKKYGEGCTLRYWGSLMATHLNIKYKVNEFDYIDFAWLRLAETDIKKRLQH